MKKACKILVIANLAILVVISLFCFHNAGLDIDGICDECSMGTSMTFFGATIFFIIQAIIAVWMYRRMRTLKQAEDYRSMDIMPLANIIPALIQMGMFSSPPDVGGHEDFTEKALFELAMLDVQFVTAVVLNAVLIAVNIAIFVTSVCVYRQAGKGKTEGQ